MKAKIYTSPENISFRDRFKKSIFLAGSIEMGKAEDWQKKLGDILLEKGFNTFNPRRKDWDASWISSYTNPQFSQQVRWELNALQKSDTIIVYIDPNTISPITLMEVGLHSQTGKLLIVCPDGFFRKGNIEVVCDIYDIPLFNTLEELLDSNHFDDSKKSLSDVVKSFLTRIFRSLTKII